MSKLNDLIESMNDDELRGLMRRGEQEQDRRGGTSSVDLSTASDAEYESTKGKVFRQVKEAQHRKSVQNEHAKLGGGDE